MNRFRFSWHFTDARLSQTCLRITMFGIQVAWIRPDDRDKDTIIYRSLVFSIIVLFMANLVGCTTLVSVPTADSILEEEKVLYVALSSGEEIRVKKPRFEDGFLAGITPKYDTLSGPYEGVRIPLDRITQIRVERFSSKKTIVTLTAITLAVGLFFYFISQLQFSELN